MERNCFVRPQPSGPHSSFPFIVTRTQTRHYGEMIKLLDRCLERSKGMPFSCFIALSYDFFHRSDHQLLFRLSCALFEHQKRWKVIQISLPFELVDELEAKRACPHFMLRAEDLGMLEAICVENPWMFSFRGTHRLSSLTSLKIEIAQ